MPRLVTPFSITTNEDEATNDEDKDNLEEE
jgi:hypothetical protein